jgi:hypothetical protein
MKAGKSAIWPLLSCQYNVNESTLVDLPSHLHNHKDYFSFNQTLQKMETISRFHLEGEQK